MYIENDFLKVEVTLEGSSLTSIYDKKNDVELLYQKDQRSWMGQDVVIFPIIGGLKDSEYIIDDGKVIWPANGDDSSKGKLIGLTKDNRLVLMNTTAKKAIESGVEDALQFGPFLIVDGKEQKISNYAIGGYLGAARVAIGQRKDGIMLF